jgi:RimJ/RimL family protein N-acetyltransferase
MGVEDAAFILELRCDPLLNRFIGDTANDVQLQKDWLKGYLQRGDDYYFCMELEKTGQRVGAVAIYNIQEDKSTAEWGRWIIAAGVLAAPASAYLIYTVAFEDLKLPQVYCRTVADNTRVVSFHDSMGAERYGIAKNGVVIRGESKDHVLHRVDQKLWKTISPRLADIAAKSQRFLEQE